jgi:hypothetical protein
MRFCFALICWRARWEFSLPMSLCSMIISCCFPARLEAVVLDVAAPFPLSLRGLLVIFSFKRSVTDFHWQEESNLQGYAGASCIYIFAWFHKDVKTSPPLKYMNSLYMKVNNNLKALSILTSHFAQFVPVALVLVESFWGPCSLRISTSLPCPALHWALEVVSF